jgi:hypothetical protein
MLHALLPGVLVWGLGLGTGAGYVNKGLMP